MDCPQCRLINPDTAQRCDCGYNFVSKTSEIKQKGFIKGRMNGAQYFIWSVPSVLLGIVLKESLFKSPWDGLTAILYFLSLVPAVIAAVRRSHDLGYSGWFALISLIPFAGLYLIFKKGNTRINQYGPPVW